MSRSGRRLVGEDPQGNKYYASPPSDRMVATTSHVKEVREVVYADFASPEEYVSGSIPPEWQAWLSGQTIHPPLHDFKHTIAQDKPPNLAEAWGHQQLAESSVDAGTLSEPQRVGYDGSERVPPESQPESKVPKLARFQPESWNPGESGRKGKERNAKQDSE